MTQYAAWSSLGGPAQQYHRATAIHRPQAQLQLELGGPAQEYHRATAIHRPQAQLQLGAGPGPKLAHMRRHGQMVVKLVTAVAREGSLKTARVPERCSKTRNVQGGSSSSFGQNTQLRTVGCIVATGQCAPCPGSPRPRARVPPLYHAVPVLCPCTLRCTATAHCVPLIPPTRRTPRTVR